MSYILTDRSEQKIHALMFKVLESIYLFESSNRCIYEHIHTDL